FFSSRRRHTRSKRDWSSDVCSSDLVEFEARYWITDLHSGSVKTKDNEITGNDVDFHDDLGLKANGAPEGRLTLFTGPNSRIRLRSEERRVGKECRSRWAAAECEKSE